MKKIKQMLSGILAMLVLFTSLSAIPVVAGTELVGTVILDEDCSDAPVDTYTVDPAADPTANARFNYSMAVGDWVLAGTSFQAYVDVLPLVKAADATGMTLQHSRMDDTNMHTHLMRKVTQDPAGENLKTGIYEISFDVTPTTDSWLTVVLQDTADYATVTGYAQNRTVLLNVVNNGARLKACNSTTGYRQTWLDDPVPAGESWIVQNNGTSASSWPNESDWKIGEADETKPLQIRAIVDMDKGLLSTYVYQEDALVASNWNVALSDAIKTNGLGYIDFGNTHGDTKVSNLKVTKLEDVAGKYMGFAEDFENSGMFAGNAVQPSATNRGWFYVPTEVSIDTTASNNVFKMNGSNMTSARVWLKTIDGNSLKGSYKINYRILAEAGEAVVEMNNSSGEQAIQMRFDADDRNVRLFVNDGTGNRWSSDNGTVTGSFDPAKWCDVEMVVSLENGFLDYIVKQDGMAVATAENVEIPEAVKAIGVDRFFLFGLNSTTTTAGATFYMDDIVIEETEVEAVQPEEPPVEPPVENEFSVDENFDSWTTSPGAAGWGAVHPSYSISQVKVVEGTNKALVVAPIPEASYTNGIKYKLEKTVSEGTLKVSYDLMVKKGQDSAGNLGFLLWTSLNAAAEGGAWGITLPTITSSLAMSLNSNFSKDVGQAPVSCGTVSENTWYTITVAARPSKSEFDFKVVNKATSEVFFEKTDIFMEDEQGNAQTSIACLDFRTWVGESWIDNLKIDYLPQKPELSNSSIKIFDSFGQQTTSITTNIPRALDRIELDFGTAMEDVSGITITGTDAPAISADIDANEPNKVVVTFDGMFKVGETYTLTVPGTVVAVNGEVMGGEGFVLEFTTVEAKATAVLTSITVGDEEIETLDQLKAKAGSTAVINTNAVNTTAADMDLTYIVAYYNGNKCLKVKTIQYLTLDSEGVIEENPYFTIESEDLTNATKVKVFLWSTLNDIIPYCEALEF